MRAVVQRVTEASVTVDNRIIGSIGPGLMVLLGVEQGDTEKDAAYLAEKLAGLRIFEDDNEKMNLSVQQVGGSILWCPSSPCWGMCAMASGLPLLRRPRLKRRMSCMRIWQTNYGRRASRWQPASSRPIWK